MAFQPFKPFGAIAKTVLPNASNSATVTVTPGSKIDQPVAVAVSAPVAPVTPTTPVLPGGPTAPITGTVTTPAADIGQRVVNTTWQQVLVALLVPLVGLFGVKLRPEAITGLFVILTPIVAFLYHFLRHKRASRV